MSTIGITDGACHSEVIVLTLPNFDCVKDAKFSTVQEAIEFVDKLTKKEKENVTTQH